MARQAEQQSEPFQGKNEGGGAIGSGTGSLEISGAHDPNAKRKAIMARHTQLSQATRETDLQEVPGAAEMQAGFEDDGSAEQEDQGTVGNTAMQTPRETRQEVLQPPEAVVSSTQPQATQPVEPEAPEMVRLEVFGREIFKPRSEVEAAGGVQALQMKLASEHRMAQAAQGGPNAELRMRQAQDLARRSEFAARNAVAKDQAYRDKLREFTGAAQPIGSPPTQPIQATPTQATVAQPADRQALIQRAVEGLWSGDPEAASRALSEVMAIPTSGQSQVDPNKIAELVVATVERDLAVKDAHEQMAAQKRSVNDLMRSERYVPIMGNPIVRSGTLDAFTRACADRRNQGRPMVEIAQEVAEYALSTLGVPTEQQPQITATQQVEQETRTRTNFKRRLPTPSSASERAPPAQQEPSYPTAPRDVVAMYRAARNQRPM
jgi:hypothetical protein